MHWCPGHKSSLTSAVCILLPQKTGGQATPAVELLCTSSRFQKLWSPVICPYACCFHNSSNHPAAIAAFRPRLALPGYCATYNQVYRCRPESKQCSRSFCASQTTQPAPLMAELRAATSIAELWALLLEQQLSMKVQHYAVLAQHAAQLARDKPGTAAGLMKEVCTQLLPRVETMTLRDVTRILLSWSQLNFVPEPDMREAISLQLSMNGKFRLQHADISTIMELLVMLNSVQGLTDDIKKTASSVAARHLAEESIDTVIKLIDTMSYVHLQPDYEFCGALARFADSHLEQLHIMATTRFLRVFALCNWYEYRLFDNLVPSLLAGLPECDSSDLAAIASIYSANNHANIMLFEAIATRTTSIIDTSPPSDTVTILQSLVHLDCYHAGLFSSFATHSQRLLTASSARHFGGGNIIALLANAYARSQHYDEALFDSLVETAVNQAVVCKTLDLCTLADACATSRHRHTLFLQLTDQAVATAWRAGQVGLDTVSTTMAALSQLAFPCHQLVHNLRRTLPRGVGAGMLHETLKQLPLPDLCSFAYGLAVQGEYSAGTSQLLGHALAGRRLQDVQMEDLQQLLHCAVGLQYEGFTELMDLLVAKLGYTGIFQAWQRSPPYTSWSSSKTQQLLVRALDDLELVTLQDLSLPDMLLHVPVAVQVHGQLVAVEVDPEQYYTINEPYEPLGVLKYRSRCLHKQGFVVLRISPHEWKEVEHSPKDVSRLLEGRLQAVLSVA